MGRPKGSSLSDEALAAKYPEVVKHIRKGKNSIRTSRISRKSYENTYE